MSALMRAAAFLSAGVAAARRDAAAKRIRIAPTRGHGACCDPVDSEVALLPHLRPANLLLIGPDAATREFLAPLMASLPSPVVFCNGAEPAFPDGPVGSLIVRDVGRLTRTHQQQLLEWLNDRSRSARVIATSAEQVFPDVTRGVFSDGLYYRLNTVTLLLNRRDPQKGQEYSPAPAQRSRAMPQADFVKK
jgi:hypothetical protein